MQQSASASNNSVLKVAVLGAGVIGLTAASHILERFPGLVDLTVISENFSPDTVTDKSGAIFSLLSHIDSSPFFSKDEDNHKRWIHRSFQSFQSIYNSPDKDEAGVSLARGYALWNVEHAVPWWKDLLFDFCEVKPDSVEASGIKVPSDCVQVWHYGTFMIRPTVLLKWLMKKVKNSGCRVEQKKVSDFSELKSDYDIIINCTGLGSCKHLAFDSSLYPVRGQMLLVRAPWVKEWVTFYDPNDMHIGIFPRGASEVALGGVKEMGVWDEEVSEETSQRILQRCRALVPSLCEAEVVDQWVGLRPCRERVRLEACEVDGSTIIHCYGHGGNGVILSWGCAYDIGDMLNERLKKQN